MSPDHPLSSNQPAPRVLHVFPTFVPAGRETRAAALINAFGARWRHEIVALDGRVEALELVRDRSLVTVRAAPVPAQHSGSAWSTLRAWRAYLKAAKPDLVLTYNWGAFDAVLAARSMGLPLVHHEDGFNSDEATHQLQRRVWARRLALRNTPLIVPSRRLQTIALTEWKLRPQCVHHIDNGIELARYQARDGAAELRRRYGIPAQALLVGWLGHLRPVKNPRRFLAALARVDAELQTWALVIGDGPERAACEELVARTHTLQGRVVFTGHQSDPVPLLRALDVLCMSSDSEQMPIALVEAMASGLPVAATAVGDIRSMLGADQEPYVVELSEHETAWPLAEALQALLADPELRARLGTQNRQQALQRYDLATMAAAHEAVWRSAL